MNPHKFLLPFKIVKHMIATSMISMFMMMFMLMTIIYHRWETVGDRDSLLWPQCFLSQLGGLASASSSLSSSSSSSFLLRLGVSAAPVTMGTRTTRATRGASTSMSAHSQKGWVDFFTLPYTLSEGVGWSLLAPTGWTLYVTMRGIIDAILIDDSQKGWALFLCYIYVGFGFCFALSCDQQLWYVVDCQTQLSICVSLSTDHLDC